MSSAPPEIFDRARRRAARDRAAGRFAAHGFVRAHIADELLARLDSVQRPFARALDLGCADGQVTAALRARGIAVVPADAGFAFAHAAGGVQCDEDRLPFAGASFDLVVAAGGLDQVGDLPGALALVRRALRPDGLFLGGFVGAGSLPRLRRAMLEADLAGGGASPRLHPQIDVRAGGDLLQRAGFALPVADGDRLVARYRGLDALLADLRFSGQSNLLAERSRRPLTRMQLAAAHVAFAEAAEPDGRTAETFELVYLIGWAPDPSQPKPARRGSGTASLAEALKPKAG